MPRAILAAAIALVTVPLVLAKEGLAKVFREALGRKAFVVCGAGLAAAAGYAACHVPIFDASISTLQPILRHSFWLAVHVATIMASYGAVRWRGAWGASRWVITSSALPRPGTRRGGTGRRPSDRSQGCV